MGGGGGVCVWGGMCVEAALGLSCSKQYLLVVVCRGSSSLIRDQAQAPQIDNGSGESSLSVYF